MADDGDWCGPCTEAREDKAVVVELAAATRRARFRAALADRLDAEQNGRTA